ncbi:hypothetical protein [Bosea beijingensis]|uniref:hypothetical protein n=1 Tax=Bosea beijingensis TaxID=3068632 RepID=UPI0027418358|nr:hypothetical protein [Bosea sp. REN20]
MQVLTVCRYDAGWAFRDVTGEAYGRSPDIRNAYEAAQKMARNIGARIEFSKEAEIHYQAVMAAPAIDSGGDPSPNPPIALSVRLARFFGWGRSDETHS